MTVTARKSSEPAEISAPSSHFRAIFRLAVPAMAALASQPILNTGETAMIGNLGAEPLAARAIGVSLIGTVYWLFAFLTFGSTTLIGRHYGARDFKACGATFFHALFLAVLGGTCIACLCIVFAGHLFAWMGAGPAVAQQGIPYFKFVVAAAPPALVCLAAVGFFRGIQDTRTPMAIAFFMAALQLAVDYVLLYGHWGAPRLGLIGAGLAVLLAQLAGASCYLMRFFLSRHTAPYRQTSWRFSIAGVRPLFRIGQDLALRTGALRGSLLFATAAATRMGAATLAAYEIAFQLFMLCSDIIDGLAVAGQALVARFLGSNQKDAAQQLGKVLIFSGMAGGLFFTLAFLGAQQTIIDFFTASPEVALYLSGGVFLLVALLQPLNGVVFVLDGFLIGARDTRYLMGAMLIGGFGIFLPISWLSLRYGWGLAGIVSGLAALMLWRLASNLYRFVDQSWMRN
jgi:putative MATE family efflux protein